MTSTIDQRFLTAAKAHAGRVAVSDGVTSLTYGDIARRSDGIATALTRAGLRDFEPVIIAVSNQAADIAAFVGAWRAGGVVVPVHRDAPPSVFAAIKTRIANRFVLDVELRPIAAALPPHRPLLHDAGTIVFTSGSTGEPKGVVLSRARAAEKLDMIQAATGWRIGENALVPLQLTFSFGQWATWLALLNGGCVHLRGRFSAPEVRELLDNGGIDRFPAVPTMLRHLLAREGGTMSFAGQIMAGGEPLAAALGRRVRAAFPAAGLGDIFGLTETGTSDFFVHPEDYDDLAGTIGRAGDGIEWQIEPATRELLVRSPWCMRGYLDAPALTAAAMEDGWFRTGDLVTEAAPGVLKLIGRSKDMIVRAGNKISPLEVESVFLHHPAVAAALMAGIDDAERGEATHLAVVPRPGHDLTPEALRDWAKDRLERFKIPDAIHVMDRLPAGATGKADRNALRRLIAVD